MKWKVDISQNNVVLGYAFFEVNYYSKLVFSKD